MLELVTTAALDAALLATTTESTALAELWLDCATACRLSFAMLWCAGLLSERAVWRGAGERELDEVKPRTEGESELRMRMTGRAERGMVEA